jgi:glucan phosphoethanolaminetransferase (alkaline phosphatase superfamily)
MNNLKLSLTLTLGAYAWYASGIFYGHKPAWIEGLNAVFGTGSNSAMVLYALAAFEIIIILILWVKPLQKIAFVGILIWGTLLMIASVALFFMEHPHWQSGVRSAWELLCLLPNAGLSYAIWKYVNEKKKQEDF